MHIDTGPSMTCPSLLGRFHVCPSSNLAQSWLPQLQWYTIHRSPKTCYWHSINMPLFNWGWRSATLDPVLEYSSVKCHIEIYAQVYTNHSISVLDAFSFNLLLAIHPLLSQMHVCPLTLTWLPDISPVKSGLHAMLSTLSRMHLWQGY